MRINKAVFFGVIVPVMFLGFVCFNYAKELKADTSEVYPQLQKFTDCLELIQKNYVENVPPEKLIEGAIKGMTSELDPHSTYLTKEGYKEMQISTTGSFGGLGIEVGIRDGYLTVISPIDGTPAFEAGIQPGDRLVKIEGLITVDMSLDEAVKLLRGPKGSKVTITIERLSEEKPFDLVITRAIIHIESVKTEMLEDGYGYIKVRSFQVDTAKSIEDALKDMGSLKGLILDLRFNPGGLLDQAVEVSDLFLDEGKIVYTDGRKPEDKTEYFAHKEGTYTDFPMVVLINGGSASAAEIVSGALQDNKRSIIVGVKSFGKASVQSIRPLSDGSAIKLTVARYYTPSGTSIQAKGIVPDIWVEQRISEEDETGAQRFIREKDLRDHLAPEEDGKEPEKDKENDLLETDNQLKYGLDLLKSWDVFNAVNNAA